MNCPYCHHIIKKRTYDGEESQKHFFEDYDCDRCKAKYCVIESNGHVVEVVLRSGNYRLVFNRDNGSCALQKGTPGEYEGVMGTYWELVKQLPTSPQNVTPQNIAEKIKTILVFL